MATKKVEAPALPVKAAAKKATNAAPTIGAQIDLLFKLREERRVLEEKAKDLSAQATEIEDALMETMEANGIDKSTGKKASVSVTSTVVANVEDWDTFHAYVKKTGFFHLLQRRVSDAPYRELLDAGKKVPGVQPFIKKRVNLRALAK